MKDNFSAQASEYAQYRPGYPPELLAYLGALPGGHGRLWDCGTGNGQLALPLAEYFSEVYATDISAAQLAEAPAHPRVRYQPMAAEAADFPDHFFDMIVVGQAVHWFDHDRFYAQVRRVLRPDGHLVLTGYGTPRLPETLQPLFADFYQNVVGPYWDAERRYIDAEYRTLPFPFAEIDTPSFSQTVRWTMAQVAGYLSTWSAVKHFERARGYSPVADFVNALQAHWPADKPVAVLFPTLLRVGRLG